MTLPIKVVGRPCESLIPNDTSIRCCPLNQEWGPEILFQGHSTGEGMVDSSSGFTSRLNPHHRGTGN